jgi:hypothetical protein
MKRSEWLGEGAGLLDVFGGHVHPDEHARNGLPNVFFAIADEAHTELALSPQDFESISCIGLLENWQTRKPELVFETKINLTMEELRETATSAKESKEYVEILSVRSSADEVEEMLKQQRASFSPVGYGCLAMFGKLQNWW